MTGKTPAIDNHTGTADILIVPHCILNPATRVKGLAYDRTAAQKLLQISDSIAPHTTIPQNIIQLPCPELLYFGDKRWEVTRDQIDIPNYRRFCRRLAIPYADTIRILHRQGRRIHLSGISKSPSCAVDITTTGYEGGLIKNANPEHMHVKGKGIFIQELCSLIEDIEIECKDVRI